MAEFRPVIIKCKEVAVTVPISLLHHESTAINKLLSCEKIIKDSIEAEADQENQINMEIIDLSEFSSQAVQILFDYLQGCHLMLESCTNFQAFEDMIKMCVKYGIKRPLPAISGRMKTYGVITESNVVEAFQLAERLKNNDEEFEDLAENLHERCIMLARSGVHILHKTNIPPPPPRQRHN